MTKALPSPNKPARIVRVGLAARQHGGEELIQPADLADAPFAPGQSPSLSARRMLLLMVATAAGEGFADKTYRLTKRELRKGHDSNDRIGDIVDEVMGIRHQIPGLSSRGRAALIKAHLFEEIAEETDDGDRAWVEFSFSRRARAIFGSAEVYAVLNRTALLAFEGKYAVTLYQLGCLYAGNGQRGRRDPTIHLTVPELRQRLGVPEGKYRDWTDLRRFVLEAAKAEVDQLAHFQVGIREHRQGRKVVSVTLGFWWKDNRGIDAAADELERPKAGRKARIRGTVEHVEPVPAPAAIAPPKPARKARPATTEAAPRTARKPRAKAAAEPVQLDLEDLTGRTPPSPESTAKRRPPTRSQRERRRPA